MNGGIRVGDRVKILRKDIVGLNPCINNYGLVTHVDGAYILVRPAFVEWETELYPNEVEVANA